MCADGAPAERLPFCDVAFHANTRNGGGTPLLDNLDNLDALNAPEVRLPRLTIGQDDEANEPPEPDPPPPPFPVSYEPGSLLKLAALEVRAAAGVSLWHVDDGALDPETRGLGLIARQQGQRRSYGRRFSQADSDVDAHDEGGDGPE